MKSYGKCCYQSLVLQHITRLYVSLRGLLSDQVREVGFCRQRLRELAFLVGRHRQGARTRRPGRRVACQDQELEVGAREKYLLPGRLRRAQGCHRQDQRPDRQPTTCSPSTSWCSSSCSSSFRPWCTCAWGPPNLVKNLAPALLHEAIRFLEPLLEGTNAAEMYLAQHTNRSQATAEIKEEVQTIFNATAPR